MRHIGQAFAYITSDFDLGDVTFHVHRQFIPEDEKAQYEYISNLLQFSQPIAGQFLPDI
jgi:hypothetical protein